MIYKEKENAGILDTLIFAQKCMKRENHTHVEITLNKRELNSLICAMRISESIDDALNKHLGIE